MSEPLTSDRDALGLRGAVESVSVELFAGGQTYRWTERFDIEGNAWSIEGLPRYLDEPRMQAGWLAPERQEHQQVPRLIAGATLWFDPISGVGFPCHGANEAEASVAEDGTPIRTLLVGPKGDVRWTIDYEIDRHRRTIEAVERASDGLNLPAALAALPYVRVRVEFNDDGRVLARTTHMLGRSPERTEFRYNSVGDVESVVIVAPDGTVRQQRRVYVAYDANNNWTHRTTTAPDGDVDERRVISYYD